MSEKAKKKCLSHLEIRHTSAKNIYKMYIDTAYCHDANS